MNFYFIFFFFFFWNKNGDFFEEQSFEFYDAVSSNFIYPILFWYYHRLSNLQRKNFIGDKEQWLRW